VLKLEDGTLKNPSDQNYRAVIIPSVTAISKTALENLHKFADTGGQVIFVGRTPTLIPDKTFLNAAEGPVDLSWALTGPSGELTDRVMAALPQPDVVLNEPCPDIKYTHRKLRDADLYFFFNESTADKHTRTAKLAGNGQAQVWDAMAGTVKAIDGTDSKDGFVTVPLELEPYESRFIVIGPMPSDG
jgi:hypothetical protein